ncbi:UNVERIFIED_CONTAM: hypothetical protein RMT77_015206 [Armadillidium vulgare]
MDMKREEEFKVEFVENTEEEVDKKIEIPFEQLSTLEQIQSLINNAAEGEKDSIIKSTSRIRSQRAVTHQQSFKKNPLENLSCRYCKISFKSRDELKTHLKTHSKGKVKCNHCSFECDYKSGLKRHLLTHSNIKLFKCSHCS